MTEPECGSRRGHGCALFQQSCDDSAVEDAT